MTDSISGYELPDININSAFDGTTKYATAAEETESETEITAEELGNLVKEFENPEEKLSEKLAESGDIEETVKEEIERVTEIEQKLEKDIAKIEGDAKKPENKPRNIFYNPSFNDFWNGVGETI